jgi:AcrR family transcriptional regulator
MISIILFNAFLPMNALTGRKAISHDRIVDVASRAVRRQGYSGVNVTEVMRAAGLTHGGFYAHFASRNALLSEAVARAGTDIIESLRTQMELKTRKGGSPFRALVESYLSVGHVKEIETGCPVSLLASEIFRQPPEVVEPSRHMIDQLHRLVKEALPPGSGAEAAWPITSALVGAVQLARSLGQGQSARAVLADTERSLLATYDR